MIDSSFNGPICADLGLPPPYDAGPTWLSMVKLTHFATEQIAKFQQIYDHFSFGSVGNWNDAQTGNKYEVCKSALLSFDFSGSVIKIACQGEKLSGKCKVFFLYTYF